MVSLKIRFHGRKKQRKRYGEWNERGTVEEDFEYMCVCTNHWMSTGAKIKGSLTNDI